MTQSRNAPIFSKLDCFFRIAKEKVPQHGEDSDCYSICEDGLILGVFDGCGGAGAKQYPAYRGKTGAYIGARAVAGTVQAWFENGTVSDRLEDNAEAIKSYIAKGLSVCKAHSGQQAETKLRGSIAKEFPTTAAVAHCVCRPAAVSLDCFWAVDSRVYLLNGDGLAQLTQDDLDGLDAYENLSNDGVLTNLISAGKPFELHAARFICQKPFIVFAATDGCFGYIPSPMEFELLLLQCLLKEKSVSDFETSLANQLEKVAGDDFTLVGASFGYGCFADLQSSLAPRYRALLQMNISGLKDAPPEQRETVWNQYRANYYRLLPEDAKI